MKVLLTEEQYNLILEVSKVDVLTNKLGFTQKDAVADYPCGWGKN
jgi:cyclopropane fatty-acyl-phospholipid synthase-like methyltransferase